MDKRFISEDQGRSSRKGQETICRRLVTITQYLSGGHGQGAMINSLIVVNDCHEVALEQLPHTFPIAPPI
uniref:Uncharacterized protein n=1 Tax=Caenorhabditis japonica TaxID=281687 RepID=A0A8R1IJB9_CAEJA